MKTLKRPVLKYKKTYVISAVVVLVMATGAYGLTRQTASPSATPAYSASASKTEPTSIIDKASSAPVVAHPDAAPASDTPQHPLHKNITATVFWVGEGADNSNDFIHNRASAWMSDWMSAYGGIDDPENRCDYRPCAFTPKENPFYFALPFNDYNENGLKPDSELQKIPWYTGSIPENTSIIKNRWIEVMHGSKVAYAQWEDVGPFGENDADYVFGTAQPAESRAGLDLSPALANYLDIDGRGVVNWRFIDSNSVPKGEWTKIITDSNVKYE